MQVSSTKPRNRIIISSILATVSSSLFCESFMASTGFSNGFPSSSVSGTLQLSTKKSQGPNPTYSSGRLHIGRFLCTVDDSGWHFSFLIKFPPKLLFPDFVSALDDVASALGDGTLEPDFPLLNSPHKTSAFSDRISSSMSVILSNFL